MKLDYNFGSARGFVAGPRAQNEKISGYITMIRWESVTETNLGLEVREI